jgi:lipopolysaccharide transport system ATP-binding protein
MSRQVIHVEGLGKEYTIGAESKTFPTLRDAFLNTCAAPYRRVCQWAHGQAPEQRYRKFWALKDVSFDVGQGEVIGIVGRNGAGKSTLLKILSRITEPTEGHAEIHGRVRALLEVGTGFHPELTGRENIFLNGAILGMPRSEIRRKFDEIVAFSEVEQFLDTPVKRYSSGMFVRLAFSVAAHLEPEILIIDEVLSVGDVGFQRKCLGKIGEVSRGGRTVVFVTHNMAAALQNCQKGILLENGRIAASGTIQQVVDSYLSSVAANGAGITSPVVDLSEAPGRRPGLHPLVEKLEIFNGSGKPLTGPVAVGAPLRAKIYFKLDRDSTRLHAGLGFDDVFGQRVFTAYTLFDRNWAQDAPAGRYSVECEIPSLTLVPGEYRIMVSIDRDRGDDSADVIDDAIRLTVVDSDYYGTGKLPWSGVCVMPHRWALESTSAALREA